MIHRIRLLLLLSAAFIALAAHNAFAAQGEIIVAKSGGQFTSIQAAINSVNPTADNPYVIKVMPGTYTEAITLKSYITLQGSGREVTTIQGTPNSLYIVTLNQLTNVGISDLSIKTDPTKFSYCIDITGSSPAIKRNTITCHIGISNWDLSDAIISDNIFNTTSWGIVTSNSSPVITDNRITAPYGSAIDSRSGAPVIRGNKLFGSGEGLYIVAGSPIVTNNIITGNTVSDIYVAPNGTPNISLNIYNTITGTTGVGLYNVKSDGTPAPAP